MVAGRDTVLKVIGFAGVSVGEVADVAIEGGVAEDGFGAGKLAGVVGGSAGHDGRIVCFYCSIYTGSICVRWICVVHKGVEVGICSYVERGEDEAF